MARITVHEMTVGNGIYRVEYTIDTADMSSIYPRRGLEISVDVYKFKNGEWRRIGYAEYQGQHGRRYFVWSNTSNVPKYVRKDICQVLPKVFERMQTIAAVVNRSIADSYVPDKMTI